MRTVFSAFVFGPAIAAAFGCGSRSPDVDARVRLLDPTAVDDHVVFVDSGRSEARLLDVSGSSAPAAPVVVPIVKNATTTELRKNHTGELLVLCAGQPDTSKDVAPEDPGLVVLRADGTSRTYRYDSPFDKMVQSDDGRYVFLFFGPDGDGGSSLRNPNEVAIIDLDQKDGKPTLKTLRSLGQTPQGVVFSPGPMSINGADRNLAVVLLDRDVALIDLTHLDRSEITVELTNRTAAAVDVSQVLFSADETPPKIYLRADGSDDVFVMSIKDALPAGGGDGGGGENDFLPSFNQVGAGAGANPSDIQLFDDGTDKRLLVAARGNGTAVIVNPDSTVATSVTLPAPASRILLYNGPKPSDPTPAERALLYDPGSSSVTFLDLEAFGTEQNRNGKAELLGVPEPYVKLVPLTADKAMLLHQSTGLSLVNLADRTLSPITGPNVSNAVADLEVGKLWLTPPGDRLGFLDLSNYHPNEVRLDATIEHFVRVPSAQKQALPRAVVTHPNPLGYMTVIDASDPANLGNAFAVSGYLFEGVLGGGAQ
jgi:hypothetical protein